VGKTEIEAVAAIAAVVFRSKMRGRGEKVSRRVGCAAATGRFVRVGDRIGMWSEEDAGGHGSVFKAHGGAGR